MPLPCSRKPSYCLHRPSGRAFVRLAGKCVYRGRHGTPESHEEYDRVIAEWVVQGRPGARIDADGSDPSVTQIIIAFWAAAQEMYPRCRRPDGKHPASELGSYFDALKLLRRLYGKAPAKDFGPLALKVVRTEMVRVGWCRGHVNNQTNRIKRVFKWAVGEELLPGELYHRLCAVEALRQGRSEAPEGKNVPPVAQDHVDAVLPFVCRQVAAMIRLQQLTGARPDEVCGMRLREIERASELWTYKPSQHKTAHRGQERVIYIGPKAQQILAPFLTLDPDRYLFSPAEADAERREKLHAMRKTPLCSGNAPGTNRQAKPRRNRGDRYLVASYRRSIQRACDAADGWHKGGTVIGNDARIVPRWHPHQLRHTTGTEVRRQFGAEAAQTILDAVARVAHCQRSWLSARAIVCRRRMRSRHCLIGF